MEDSVSKFLTDLFLRKPLAYENNQLLNGQGGLVPCGSANEFHIVPVLSCISDNDVLFCLTNDMAFSGKTIVLSDDFRCFDEMIECVRILPYENYPGYVKLFVVGNLIYNWELEKYEYFEATEPRYASGNIMRQALREQLKDDFEGPFNAKFNGPALKKTIKQSIHDDVYCICYPKWPREAKEWTTRKRNGKWPHPAIILEVVRNGCHVVCAQHRDCREDDLQFRFSFSLAEVILLRTWTPNQQLIYHMLRFFAKRELIEANCPKEKEVLCSYHLKTLMLWTCEQESPDWWISSKVILICCKLLRRLLEWMEKRHCPNYFIPEANMFSGKIDPIIVKCIVDKIKFICQGNNLTQWFVDNYLLSSYENLIRGRSPHEFREFQIDRLYQTFLRNKGQDQLQLFDDRFTALSCGYMIGVWNFSEIVIDNELKEFAHMNRDSSMSVRRNFVLRSEKPFIYLDSALFMLYAANTITSKRVLNCNDFLSDILSVVSLGTTTSSDWRRYHNFPKAYRERLPQGHVCFLIAQDHMGKLGRPGDDPQFQLISRLSMHYLRIAFGTKDLSARVIRTATVVYIAAICFATSQFQAAFDLCSTIIQKIPSVHTSKMPERQEKPLNAGCLIFIDEVSNCIGLIATFNCIIKKLRIDHRQFVLDTRFTPRVFAEYLMIQSANRLSRQLLVNWSESPTAFLIDSLFKKTVKRK